MRRASFLPIVLFAATVARAADSPAPVSGTPSMIAAPDGAELAVTYYSPGKPGPGILLLHQCNKDRSSWNALAQGLARAGFHVVTLDYRGFGGSPGRPLLELSNDERTNAFTNVWPGDVDAAFAYLRSRPGVGKVYGAGGASCGVDQAIQLARRHPEVRSLVLLSGNTERDGRRSLKSKSSPPLFLAGADDDGRIIRVLEWIDASSGNPANRFVEYESGGHGTVMFESHPELPGEIVAWFEATLAGKGKPASTDNRARRESPEVRLLLTADEGGFGRVVETLNGERARDPKSPALEESFVNTLGYVAIQEGDAKNALAMMQMNVEAKPGSSNAWDSLADAYLAAGQIDKAREASEKSLALIDADSEVPPDRKKAIRENAQARLDRLKTTVTPPPK